jgi:RHS repeat-associated protein
MRWASGWVISSNTLGLSTSLYDSDAGSRSTGKERDAESGNDYFLARYYSSALGRFMSPDWSAKEEPVPYATMDDPQSLNLYAYVRNNPLARTDPDGHCCEITWNDVQTGFEMAGAAVTAAEAGVVALGAAAFAGAAYSAAQGNSPYSTNGYPTTMSYSPGARFSPDVKKGKATEADQTCQICGTKTVPAEKSKKGVTPPSNEGQTDHKKARSKGGDNSPSNAEHVCRKCNREKSDKDVPPAPAPPPPPQPPPPPTTPPAGE